MLTSIQNQKIQRQNSSAFQKEKLNVIEDDVENNEATKNAAKDIMEADMC